MSRFAVNALVFIGMSLLAFAGCSKTTAAKTAGAKENTTTESAAPDTKKSSADESTAATTQAEFAVKQAAKENNQQNGADTQAAPPEEILLGTAELTQGIPGDGTLSVEVIQKWLDDPKSHVSLKPTLPQGLAAGASQVAGLDLNPLTRAKIELGRQLYFDPRLSKDGSISCASCHHPDNGYAKDTQFGEGVGGQKGNRNSPVAYNRILSSVQFWDGRAPSLEEQAKGPIANPIEMSNTHDVCVNHLGDINGYKVQFDRIFPDGVTIDNVAKAIASFERALVTGPSPWDYYEPLKSFQETYAADLEDLAALEKDDPDMHAEYMKLTKAAEEHAMSDSAKRGATLFFSEKAGCTACHVGANFTDEKYHNLGVGMDAADPDLGRFKITNDEKGKGAFKTPTVRNVELTGPYMHDGSQKTLEEVVEWYNKGGHKNPWLDEKVKPLNLTEQEKADLVAYMKTLTGPLPKVEHERLPE